MDSNRLKVAPMRVVILKGSKAAGNLIRSAGIDPKALAPGLSPTPDQDLRFHGGKTIQDLAFANFYVAGATSWDAGDMANIDRSLSAAMSDRNLNNVMLQYFNNQPITSTFLGSQKLSGEPPVVVSQGDTEALVRAISDAGMLDGMDLDATVVNLLLPKGTILTTDEAPTSNMLVRSIRASKEKPSIPHEDQASSEFGLGGYHGSVHLTMSGVGKTIYYAVAAYSEITPDGTRHGIPAFPAPWKSVAATFYHELNEARTDSDVEDAIRTNQDSFLGWTSDQGEECGDFPIDESDHDLALVFQEVPLADGSGTVPVQFQYSNAVHGPEGPIAQPHPLP